VLGVIEIIQSAINVDDLDLLFLQNCVLQSLVDSSTIRKTL
jgi:hypothetical protein